MTKIIPAILTSDEKEYHKRLLMAERVSDLIQIDMIDGKFAKNTTVGTKIINKYLSSSMLEIQLMVEYPQNYIDELVSVGHINRIIVPFEISGGLTEAIYHIKNHNKQAGLSLNPQTPIKTVVHYLDDIDLILLLAVNPGFSGQKLQEDVFNKIHEVKKIIPQLAIEVDGGINKENIAQLSRAGANFLAVNSALFKAEDFQVAYEDLEAVIKRS